ncbi:DUF3107 domain-containing protein [Thermopolyspora sp. NPDC052614]|uniref:DUF3107 domain-containing protein n=1 Tax=Thermopolyspora sp. NPDC052614 TaxID=3155682 RepID=UPI0034426A0A
MEVKIGVRSVHRELVVETDLTPDQVETALRDALGGQGVFALTDSKGRRVIVPVSALGFVEIGEDEQRPVGFGAR